MIKLQDTSKIVATVARETLERLEHDSRVLGELEALGVDNWDGYSEAIRNVRKMEADIARATT